MILWSFFWKNGYNVTSQILELCIVNWSMKKNEQHKPNENLAMVLIIKKHRKQNELFLQYGYKLNCSKVKISLNLYKIHKIEKSHKKCAISRNLNENWHVNKMPYLQQNIHTKNWKRAKFEYIKKLHQ